jgi:hypothetical protein
MVKEYRILPGWELMTSIEGVDHAYCDPQDQRTIYAQDLYDDRLWRELVKFVPSAPLPPMLGRSEFETLFPDGAKQRNFLSAATFDALWEVKMAPITAQARYILELREASERAQALAAAVKVKEQKRQQELLEQEAIQQSIRQSIGRHNKRESEQRVAEIIARTERRKAEGCKGPDCDGICMNLECWGPKRADVVVYKNGAGWLKQRFAELHDWWVNADDGVVIVAVGGILILPPALLLLLA